MFIDIHVHVSKELIKAPEGVRWPGQVYCTPEQLLERYAEIDVERAVLLPRGSPECGFGVQSNEQMLEIAARDPVFIPFCNVDPRSLSNSADASLDLVLGYYRDQGCRGLGEVLANLPILDPLIQNLFRHTEAVGLPLTFHIAPQIGGAYGLYDDPGLPQLERSLQHFPNLCFLGHSQAFWAEIGTLETPADRYGYPRYPVQEEGVVPKLMRRYPNLYGDLSAGSGHNALARDRDYAIQFLTEFQDRLMFGTDITSPSTPTPLVGLLLDLRDTGDISETVFNKVARENAVTLLDL